MRIKDKIILGLDGLIAHGPVNITAFGDSVTHGCVGPGEYDYETVYWNRLRKKLNAVNVSMPVNAIDAGINGITAKASLGRIERDVLSHRPDLVIVCFGLNDVNGSLEDYLSSYRGAIIAVLGIGMVAVPTSILSAGFVEFLEKKNPDPAAEEKSPSETEKKYCPYCGKKLD